MAPKIYHKGRYIGKLCSDKRINNADLYVAFYKWGGYNYAQIAWLFDKNYHTVRQAIQRAMDPDKYRL